MNAELLPLPGRFSEQDRSVQGHEVACYASAAPIEVAQVDLEMRSARQRLRPMARESGPLRLSPIGRQSSMC